MRLVRTQQQPEVYRRHGERVRKIHSQRETDKQSNRDGQRGTRLLGAPNLAATATELVPSSIRPPVFPTADQLMANSVRRVTL